MSKLADLHAAALPFVTRSLRGGRLRRYALLSALLAGLSGVLGGWLALGDGSFEREVRVALDLEESRWQREQNDFVVVTDSPEEAALVRAEMGPAPWTSYRYDHAYSGRGQAMATEAVDTLLQAARRDTFEHRELRDQVVRTLDQHRIDRPTDLDGRAWGWFDWNDPEHVRRVRAILAADLTPRIEVYRSPLGLEDAVRMTGGIAGAFMAALLLILAPLLAGAQMAQEVHENTLMPLTGTALRARQLVLGLTAGPFAVIALLAAPQALLLLLTAALAGHLVPALAAVGVAAVGAFMLGTLTQHLGYVLGAQRAPGVVGVGLLGFLGFFALVGAGFGLFPTAGSVGVLALLPEAAVAHLVRSAFAPHALFFDRALAAHADVALAVGTVGIGILGVLGLRALERRVGRSAAAALTRGEALLGAAVATGLVLLANPVSGHYYSPERFYLANLAVLSVPFAVFLMMRVPVAEIPTALRRVPVAPLLGELFAFAGLHIAATLVLLGEPAVVLEVHPVAFLYLAWYLLMLGLVAIRAVARPMGLAARVWVGFAACFALLAFPHMAAWTSRYGNRDVEDLFAFYQLSPALGVVQAVLMVVVPWLLLRGLRPRA